MALSKEYDAKGTCSASKKYQDLKLDELELQKEALSPEIFQKKKNSITEKACLCVGLANASYLENDIKIKGQAQGVIICPGPNMAYFDHEVSLSEMVKHIYGKASVMKAENRPNLYVKELKMYLDYLKNEIECVSDEITAGQIKKWHAFKNNLMIGIGYYEDLFSNNSFFEKTKKEILNQFDSYKLELTKIEIPELVLV